MTPRDGSVCVILCVRAQTRERVDRPAKIEALRIGSWESYRNTYHELALQDAQR